MKHWRVRTWVATVAVSGAILWVMFSWFAPIDITIPTRQYPPDNAGGLYEKLGLWRSQREFNDPEFREGMRFIREQQETDLWIRRPLTPEEEEKLETVVKRFEEVRPIYLSAVDQPCVMPFEYNLMAPSRSYLFFLALARVEEWHMNKAWAQRDFDTHLNSALAVLKISQQINHKGAQTQGFASTYARLRVSLALSQSLPDLSQQECERLAAYVQSHMKEKTPLSEIARHQAYSIVGTYQEILKEQRRARSTRIPMMERRWEVRHLKWISPRLAAREVIGYYQQRGEELDKPLLKQKPSSRPLHPTNAYFVSDLGQLDRRDKLAETQLRLIGCAAAVRAHQLKTGNYPRTLAEAGVQDLNQDPYSGGEFIYKVDPAKAFLLYSVGADGKEDGGQRLDDAMQGDVAPTPAEWKSDGTLSVAPVWLK